jgi:hypothetical protein
MAHLRMRPDSWISAGDKNNEMTMTMTMTRSSLVLCTKYMPGNLRNLFCLLSLCCLPDLLFRGPSFSHLVVFLHVDHIISICIPWQLLQDACIDAATIRCPTLSRMTAQEINGTQWELCRQMSSQVKTPVNLSPARSAICHVALFTRGPVHCKPSRQCPRRVPVVGGKDGGLLVCWVVPYIPLHLMASIVHSFATGCVMSLSRAQWDVSISTRTSSTSMKLREQRRQRRRNRDDLALP